MDLVARRFEVHLVSLDPTVGSEIQKIRPCVVISPDEINRHLRTVIIVPLTSGTRPFPSRVDCRFRGKQGQIMLEQIRTVDRSRLLKRLGTIPTVVQHRVLERLAELFAP